MPAMNQSAVSTLIREVLADPDLAHDDVSRRLLQAGSRGPGRRRGPAPRRRSGATTPQTHPAGSGRTRAVRVG